MAPALRLAVEDARLVTWRPLVVALGLLARLLRIRSYALWPDIAQPVLIADLSHPAALRWVRDTFESRAPRSGVRRFLGPSTLNALRARALVWGAPSRLTLETLERAGGSPPREPRWVVYSTTGEPHVKATCFVFDGDQDRPSLVVKTIPDRRFEFRLRSETEIVERVRERVGDQHPVAAALPLPPLFAGEVRDDYLVVQELDPFARKTGREDRRAALEWLEAFQFATTATTEPWNVSDNERELAIVRDAWQRVRPERATAVVASTRGLLDELGGEPIRRCTVHGDFWRGNIASEGGRLRVYDWEWAEEGGAPFFDIWMYELGPLRLVSEGLAERLRRSVSHVQGQLEARSIDVRFALAMLAPALGLFIFRERGITGSAGTGEENAGSLMQAAEQLLFAS